MPLPLPDLDTLTYNDLTTQAENRIPQVLPAWTNYNPSDPGIMLVELFAWLTEILGYRADQVTSKNVQTFLRLLNDPTWTPPDPNDAVALNAAIRDTLNKLYIPYRAVTANDYIFLVLQQYLGQIARVQCVPLRNLAADSPDDPAPAHLSVVIVPQDTTTTQPTPTADLCTQVGTFLADRRQLTTRLHVVGPHYVPITLTATLYLQEGMTAQATLTQASADLLHYFQPLPDAAGRGWPFGQAVHLSDISAVLSAVQVNGALAVNYILTDPTVPAGFQPLTLTTSDNPTTRQQRNGQNVVVSITLKPYELAALVSFTLVAVETNGNQATITLGPGNQVNLTQAQAA